MRIDNAFALIFWKDKILLFHRDNISTIPNPDTWALPGGAMEKGESKEEAVKRELAEEVSYVPARLDYVGFYTSEGKKRHVFITFVGDEEAKKFKLGPGEGQGIAFISLDNISSLKLAPKLRWLWEKNSAIIRRLVKTRKIPTASELGLLD